MAPIDDDQDGTEDLSFPGAAGYRRRTIRMRK